MKKIIISMIIIVLIIPGASLFGIICGNDTNGAYGSGTSGDGKIGTAIINNF
jgi:hypothetical protein